MHYDETLRCVCPAINLEQISDGVQAYRKLGRHKTRIPIGNSFSHALSKARVTVRCPTDWHGVGTASLPLYQHVRAFHSFTLRERWGCDIYTCSKGRELPGFNTDQIINFYPLNSNLQPHHLKT
jgi:hypothetical protein